MRLQSSKTAYVFTATFLDQSQHMILLDVGPTRLEKSVDCKKGGYQDRPENREILNSSTPVRKT